MARKKQTKSFVRKIVYRPEPTPLKFHQDSTSVVRSLMGPIGSGKSVCSVIELLERAKAQEPSPDGVRRTRWAIIRNTFPELKSTTINTFKQWIPGEICTITYGSPITGRMHAEIPDGTVIDAEFIFVPVDSPRDVKKLLSMELTGAWINEVRETPKALVDALIGRTGRFPGEPEQSKPTWSGVIMDTNPPDDDHWLYRMAEEEKPSNWGFYQQPPAIIKVNGEWEMNPEAENVAHLPLGADYYMRQIPGKDIQWIRVYLEGKYGTLEDGRPVYPEFNEELHLAKYDNEAIEGHPLIVSFDFGLTPACAISQLTPRGGINVLDEISTPIDRTQGIESFVEGIVMPFLATKYANWPMNEIKLPCDPAGTQRAQSDEKTCFQSIRKISGGKLRPLAASTNNPKKRQESIRFYLNTMVDGKPAFQLNPRCKVIRKGFNGGYKYNRVKVSNEERYLDSPNKNIFSHIMEALEYGALYTRGHVVDAPRQTVADGKYDELHKQDHAASFHKPEATTAHDPFYVG